jgi:integrase
MAHPGLSGPRSRNQEGATRRPLSKVVSEQLGHASTAFTLDTYAHVLPHMQDEAAARVEAMLLRQTA